MDLKKEGVIITILILTIYAISIPLTEKMSNTYTYDGMTFTYKKVKAYAGYGVTSVYTFALKGAVDYRDTNSYITINNTPVTLLKIVRDGTQLYVGTFPKEPTKVNLYNITFQPYTPLIEPVPITFLALTIIAILGTISVLSKKDKSFKKRRRLFIISIIVLAFAVFSVESWMPYYQYDFNGISFTASNSIHVVTKSTIETDTPFTAKILPLGTHATLTITAPGDKTFKVYYYESIGYLFTEKTPYKSLWTDGTTATLEERHTYVWQFAAAYTIIFIVFFIAVLFAYSYLVEDVLE